MAGYGEEETEYESDPEEAKLSLKMRRKEASDEEDEEEKEGERGGEERRKKKSARSGMDSDGESDGQGGAAEYDDEELEVDEEEEEYYEEEEEGEEIVVAEEEYGENGGEVCGDGRGESLVLEGMERDEAVEVGESSEGHGHHGQGQTEEEKKENEPFMVPTAGAFYMHDDRFSDNVGGRHRRTFGGRKLWESKDDRKWGHDKFEEMNMKERQYDERGKPSRGRPRGRGRGRGSDRGYVRGSRSRSYIENINQNVAPKTLRGRGPRRYQALSKGKSDAPLPQSKQLQKPLDKTSHASSGRANTSAPHTDFNPIPPKRVASNLSSASPPFYPSGSSKKDNALTPKRGDQSANLNRNIHPPAREKLPVQQSSSLLRGKNVVDSIGMENLHMDDPSLARQVGNVHLPSASLSKNVPQSRGQRRDVPFSGLNSFEASPTRNQIRKTSSAGQSRHAQHVQGRGQASLPVSAQQFSQRPASASQGSSAPQSGVSIASLESGDADSSPESSKSKTALVGKGKGTAQRSGQGSFFYGNPQVMGSAGGTMGAGHGDQNLSASPTFLPVMQFGGQHPGGMGVPAVGMAFPGYVAQSQHGVGNSEMTWLPVLTGAGPLGGAAYYPPYIGVDGSYHARPAGQTPALAAPSKDNNANKPNNEGKSQQKPDHVNDEFSQRQNKPRRYSEMNFGQ